MSKHFTIVQLVDLSQVVGGHTESGDIIVGQMRCRVMAIQPLDLARLKADRGVANR